MSGIIPDKDLDGNLITSIKSLGEFPIDVQLGNIIGFKAKTVFGNNPAVRSIKETLWADGSIYEATFTPSVITINSTSVSDSPNFSGAHAIVIYGLDSSYNEISEVVTLNGLISVQTTQQFLRVNDARVVATGSSNKNVGRIAGSISGERVLYIKGYDCVHASASYTVPAGKTAYVKLGYFSGTNSAKGIELDLISVSDTEIESVEQTFYLTAQYSALSLTTVFPIPEKCMIRMDAKNLESGTVGMTAGLDMYLKDN